MIVWDLIESTKIGPTSRSFQSPEKEKKEKKILKRKHPKNVFFKTNYAEIILQKCI